MESLNFLKNYNQNEINEILARLTMQEIQYLNENMDKEKKQSTFRHPGKKKLPSHVKDYGYNPNTSIDTKKYGIEYEDYKEPSKKNPISPAQIVRETNAIYWATNTLSNKMTMREESFIASFRSFYAQIINMDMPSERKLVDELIQKYGVNINTSQPIMMIRILTGKKWGVVAVGNISGNKIYNYRTALGEKSINEDGTISNPQMASENDYNSITKKLAVKYTFSV